MAKKYIIGIDETGAFCLQGKDPSFVCGVLIKGNELELKTSYQHLYEDFGFPAPTPTKCEDLLQDKSLTEGDKARFHFNKLTPTEREQCKARLLGHVDHLFISSGKPALYANNQNWWLIAIVVVIREFLKHTQFEPNSEIEVWIDCRKDYVWGILESERPEHKDYHNMLKQQIEKLVGKNVREDCKLTIQFRSDTSNFFINLADIICGLVRRDMKFLEEKSTKCSCQSFTESNDPLAYVDKNPLTAFSLIMQEVTNNMLANATQITKILSNLRKDTESYAMAWEMVRELLKFKIGERKSNSHIVSLKPVVEDFKSELAKPSCPLALSKRLEMITLMMEYYSHIGDIDRPFSREQFIHLLKEVSPKGETRIHRKWEKLLSYSLREAQILFNDYNFNEAKGTLDKLYNYQDAIINTLPTEIFGEDAKKDEPTAAILGTLAQAYAYTDELESAIEYFQISKEYAIKTSSTTDSYLCNIYHRMMDIEHCREAFTAQSGMLPEEYAMKGNFSNQWVLLNYCKICALEWQCNKHSQLPLPIDYIQTCQLKEYPFPLILKWAAVTLFLQDPQHHRSTIEQLLNRALTELLNGFNGFTIQVLALPIIQCYALVNNQNPYHAQYGRILRDLTTKSDCFADYINQKIPLLNSIKNDADIWQRAIALPFIYS